jgi:hypothetical protein
MSDLFPYFKQYGIHFILVTPKTLDFYIKKAGVKLHEGFKYLSAIHKSDYLRCYFMHFFGGGYIDIKQAGLGWVDAFDKLYHNSDSIYCVSQHIREEDVSGDELCKKNSDKMMAMGAFICKYNTPFTKDWYNSLQRKMDEKLEDLKKNPATHAREPPTGSSYPIAWGDILGGIFHPLCYKYHKYIMFTPIALLKSGVAYRL